MKFYFLSIQEYSFTLLSGKVGHPNPCECLKIYQLHFPIMLYLQNILDYVFVDIWKYGNLIFGDFTQLWFGTGFRNWWTWILTEWISISKVLISIIFKDFPFSLFNQLTGRKSRLTAVNTEWFIAIKRVRKTYFIVKHRNSLRLSLHSSQHIN